MASVVVTGVKLLENPAMFNQVFKFEITFECLTPLEDGTFLVPHPRVSIPTLFCSSRIH